MNIIVFGLWNLGSTAACLVVAGHRVIGLDPFPRACRACKSGKALFSNQAVMTLGARGRRRSTGSLGWRDPQRRPGQPPRRQHTGDKEDEPVGDEDHPECAPLSGKEARSKRT